jgi:hypothetical protein
MNNKLKTLENLTRLLYNELKSAADHRTVGDNAYVLLKEAAIDAINLQRKIEAARAWNIQKDVTKD